MILMSWMKDREKQVLTDHTEKSEVQQNSGNFIDNGKDERQVLCWWVNYMSLRGETNSVCEEGCMILENERKFIITDE